MEHSAVENSAGSGDVTGGVVVAVLTYRRPVDLAEVLPVLVGQLAAEGVVGHVLVVDNDPAGSGKDTVDRLGDPRIRYVNETRPGIAAARNRALDESSQAAVLVFIDDDERPSAPWLGAMLAMYRRTGCAAVVGPVVSEYESTPEDWITAGRFFERRRLATGTSVEAAATNNLLLDLAEVRALGLRFDERFGLTGGSDTLFTRELTGAGRLILWCDEALVVDVVPASRLTRRWVLQKAFRSGNSWTRTSLEMAGSPAGKLRVRAAMTARALPRIAGGSARLAAGALTRSVGWRARGLRTVARGAGMATGAFGYVYSEYRRPASH